MERKYIVLSIKEDYLIYEYKNINVDRKYVNNHKLYNECFLYDLKYFKRNKYHIINNLKKSISDNIKTLVICSFENKEYIKFLMESLNLSILKNDFLYTLSIDDFDFIGNINGIKCTIVYYMPDFIKKIFVNRDIEVKVNCENKISDRFMLSQDCFDYDSLYYRKHLEIKEYYDGIYGDILEFLRVNYFLKAIYIRCFKKEFIEAIINLLKEDESKNVCVFLHQQYDENDFIKDNFVWLKEINERCKSEEICEFRIVYSDRFIRGNLFKQLTFNNLKLMCILGLYVFGVMFIISKSYAYVEELNTDKVNIDIMNSINNIVESENNDEETEELIDGEVLEDEVSEKEEKKGKYDFDIVFSKLKKINKDTVGFLTVNNTKISYPVVQGDDNNYYLKRDFYKNKTSMGWIYMDYRNNPKKIDDNTIIYGHNMRNDTMFGSLDKVLSSSWRRDEENMVISYETEEGVRLYKIFSIYKVDYTTDYLKTSFKSEDAFEKFVKMIKKRSIFSSKENIKYGDKILTLSTCTGTNNKRLVVHAVLIEN